MSTTTGNNPTTGMAREDAAVAAATADTAGRVACQNVKESMNGLARWVAEQSTSETFKAFNHASWQDYVTEMLAQELPELGGAWADTLIDTLLDLGLNQTQTSKATGKSLGKVNTRAQARKGAASNGAATKKGAPQPDRAPSTFTSRAVSALVKVQENLKVTDKVSDANLTEVRAMAVQVIAEIDAEIARRDEERAAVNELKESISRHPAGHGKKLTDAQIARVLKLIETAEKESETESAAAA